MLLFVLRHGKAEPGSPGRDAERHLAPDGEESLRRVLQRAAAAGLKPDALLASPYVRARETAEIAQQVLGFAGRIYLSSALVPESDSQTVWDEVRVQSQALREEGAEAGDGRQLMLVGHNPLLSDFLLHLLEAGVHGIDLRPGGLACMELDSIRSLPRGKLRWLLTPEICE